MVRRRVSSSSPRRASRKTIWRGLRKILHRGVDVPVRISGWLLFDPQHTNHLKKYRSTLWEIHPITKIEVWDTDTEKWVNLDDAKTTN